MKHKLKGSIVSCCGKFRVFFDIGRDPITGKRVRYNKTHRTYDEAFDDLVRLNAAERAGTLDIKTANPIKLGKFASDWLKTKKVRASTYNQYQRCVNKMIGPVLGHLPLSQISIDRLEDFYQELESGDIKNSRDKPYGKTSIIRMHKVLSQILKNAVTKQLMPMNPAKHVSPPKHTVTERDVFSEKQLKTFLLAARNNKYHDAYIILSGTGLRRGELCALTWNNIDFENSRISVRKALTYTPKKGITVGPPKSDSSVRKVPMLKAVKKALLNIRNNQSDIQLSSDYNLVICKDDGSPINPDSIRKEMKKVLSRVPQLPSLTVHDLRHTFATLLLKNGIDIKTISTILGHAMVQITMDLYLHPDNDSMQQEMNDNVDSTFDDITSFDNLNQQLSAN